MDLIYLDFQKDFDKVPHQRLLIKLKSHGIQYCKMGTKLSNRQKAKGYCGWGYITMAGDLEDDIASNIIKFADDIKISEED